MEFCAGAEQCGASCTLGGLSGHIQTEALQFKFRARKNVLISPEVYRGHFPLRVPIQLEFFSTVGSNIITTNVT